MDTPAAPRVTLITTFRNASRHLASCVESVRAQTDPRWRLLLLDDGSTDDSLAVARRFAHDPRVDVLPGPARGRRRALAAAHARVATPYVGWVDADDLLLPRALEATLSVMDRFPRCGLVYTDHRRIDEGGVRLRHAPRPTFSRVAMLTDFVPFHFRLIRTDVLEQCGGISESFEIGIDYEMCLRIASRSSVVHLAETLYVYRQHANQMSSRHRITQRNASLRAVNDAVRRVGLCDQLRIELTARGRFVRRVRPLTRPWPTRVAPWARLALRRRAKPTTAPRVASIWPFNRADPIAMAVEDGLFQAGIAHRPVPRSVEGLLRAAVRGEIGDLLVVGGVLPRIATHRPGTAAARLTLLRIALARVRAQRTKIVWLGWSDLAHRGRAHALRRIARDCDAVVVDPARPLPHWLASASRVIRHRVPCVREHVALARRTPARAALRLDPDAPVIACLGPGDATLLPRLEAFVRQAPPEARLLLPRPTSRTVDAPSSMVIPVDVDRPRALGRVMAAADAIVVASGPEAPTWDALARAHDRPAIAAHALTGHPGCALLSALPTRCARWRERSPLEDPPAQRLIDALLRG